MGDRFFAGDTIFLLRISTSVLSCLSNYLILAKRSLLCDCSACRYIFFFSRLSLSNISLKLFISEGLKSRSVVVYGSVWVLRCIWLTSMGDYNKIMAIAQIQIKSIQHLLAKRQQIIANNVLPVGLPDAAAYYYMKQASFFGKKQQRWTFFLFQGLNTNPQNLSIYLRDEAQRENKGGKQKLSKGVFAVHDLFSRCDVVVEINIPGNLRIFKMLAGKKELVSNEEMDLMYLSSALRAMYQSNLPWGRYYLLFHDSKNFPDELRAFFAIAFRALLKRDLVIPGEFESGARVKGSHACSLIFGYLKERRLVRHGIEVIEELLQKSQEFRSCAKYRILLAELYSEFGKTSRSLQQVHWLLQRHPGEPFLVFYQAKYLFESSLYRQALSVANSIVQLNQFQIWYLLASIHLQLKNFGELLVCLNHAVRSAKLKGLKNMDAIYHGFEELGKAKLGGTMDSIENSPKLLVYTDNPLGILVKEVEEKNKFLVEKGYWKLNANEKNIYAVVQDLRYRLQNKRFQQLLLSTFDDNIPKSEPVLIRRGISLPQSQAQEGVQLKLVQQQSSFQREQEQQLPEFLKNSIEKVQQSVSMKPSRNLSIIAEIESVIQNSNYEQRQKERGSGCVRFKREVQEGLFRVVQLVMGESEFEKAEYEGNVGVILQVYNKMRTSSKFNNYYADRMFRIFIQVANYRSIIVLIAETLDFLEQRGVRKIDKLPYWMHKYLFFIIEEKGLKFLNEMLQKMNLYDEAIIDTIEIAKSWKMKGITY